MVDVLSRLDDRYMLDGWLINAYFKRNIKHFDMNCWENMKKLNTKSFAFESEGHKLS